MLDVAQIVHKRGTLEHWRRKYKLANIETDYHDAFGLVFKTNRLISTLKKGIYFNFNNFCIKVLSSLFPIC